MTPRHNHRDRNRDRQEVRRERDKEGLRMENGCGTSDQIFTMFTFSDFILSPFELSGATLQVQLATKLFEPLIKKNKKMHGWI